MGGLISSIFGTKPDPSQIIGSDISELNKLYNTVVPGRNNSSSAPLLGILKNKDKQAAIENQEFKIKRSLFSEINKLSFKTSREIIMVHQRHGTTFANVLNKGFEQSSIVKEFAPNTPLNSIGFQQLFQISDFLLHCKSKNINYVIGDNISIDDLVKQQSGGVGKNNKKVPANLTGSVEHHNSFGSSISVSPASNSTRQAAPNSSGQPAPNSSGSALQQKTLRPILLFCCSELFRTQQTIFITYFNIIIDYLKNGRKIIILPWLNEKRGPERLKVNADNFVVNMAHTNAEWKKFIGNFTSLSKNSSFMGSIGRKEGDTSISNKIDLSKILTSKILVNKNGKQITIDYSNWDDIFYLPTSVYKNIGSPEVPSYEFDKKLYDLKNKGFPRSMCEPSEMYDKLPEIFSTYFLGSTIITDDPDYGIITDDPDYGVDFYEPRIGPNVRMNIVFVSHHSSGENVIKYATEGDSDRTFQKQQFMNGEIVILPKGGIMGKRLNPNNAEDISKLNAFIENYKKFILKKIDRIQIDNKIKNKIKNIFEPLPNQLVQVNKPKLQELVELLKEVSSSNKKNDPNLKDICAIAETLIAYSNNQQQNSQPSTFGINNRIFPVGFYNSIINQKIKRKNKRDDIQEIYPLYILYNPDLNIFFSIADIVKQVIAILLGNTKIRNKDQPVQVVTDSGSEEQQNVPGTLNLSFPLEKFFKMTVSEYNEFIIKIRKILEKINDFYSKNQLNFFYNYNELLKECTPITLTTPVAAASPAAVAAAARVADAAIRAKGDNVVSNVAAAPAASAANVAAPAAAPTTPITTESSLLEYLRDKYDIKYFIQSLIRFLFDFCTDKEDHLTKIREIIRTKLNLQITDKDIDKLFNEEFKKQLEGNFGKHYGNRQHNPPKKSINNLEEYKLSKTTKCENKKKNKNYIKCISEKYNKQKIAQGIYSEYGILSNSNSNKLNQIKKNLNNLEKKMKSANGLSLLNKIKYKTPEIKKDKLGKKIKQISYGFKRKFLERPYVLYKNTPSIIV